jgi:alanine dehydrogenase
LRPKVKTILNVNPVLFFFFVLIQICHIKSSSMNSLLISRSSVSKFLTMSECIIAVEAAFKSWALGHASTPGILGIHAKDGGFHMKAGILDLGRTYFVAKTNANFPKNRTLFGLPTIQGVISVSDATNGTLLALMDSIEITIIRTGAATGVAAKYFSRKDSSVLTVVGCGNQGAISVKAILEVRPIKKVFLYDIDPVAAGRLATSLKSELRLDVEITTSIAKSAIESDIVVTCTSSNRPILFKGDVRPGSFIAAVGTDSESKQEIDPHLLASSKVVADSIDQCTSIGDLHHAIDAGLMTREKVYAELGQVVAGLKVGRASNDEVIVFDSTGTGLQDVAAAAIVYERAMRDGTSQAFDFGP